MDKNRDKKLCSFCDALLESYNGYYVCPNCKTVAFVSHDISNKKKAELIDTFLEKVRAELVRKHDYLYSLEQRYMLKNELSEKELKIQNTVCEYTDIHTLLQSCYIKFIKNDERYLNDVGCRKLLYRLLMISDWLKEYLELGD